MARYHGQRGVVYASTTGTGAATTQVSLTAWTLDSSTDKVDVSAFGDANKTYVTGLPDVKGTLAGWLDDTGLSIFTGAASADGVKLYLYPASNAPTVYWYGPAWLDASVNTPATGAVSISGNFVANGGWGRKP